MVDTERAWEIVLAFFIGGAVSSIAQDPSDTIFFYVSSKGALTPYQQTVYWYFVPFLIYIFFFLLGWALSRTGRVSPLFIVYLYLATIIVSAYFSLQLPQASTQIYVGAVILGTAVSIGILYGLRRSVMRYL